MTPAIQKAIEESRRRDEKAKEGFGVQSNESLQTLANDVGILTNPWLHIAASVAAELLRRRQAEPRFREALAAAVEGLRFLPSAPPADVERMCADALARIEAILGGEK